MPNYQYKARDKFGKPLSGVMLADDESAVAVKLNQLGYIPILIIETKQSSKIIKFLGARVRVKFTAGHFAKSRPADFTGFKRATRANRK
jgi:type II secretory pathway component PulF